MFNVGGGEILVILLLGLVVLGPDKLPETARSIGRHLSTVRRVRDGFQQELHRALDPLTPSPPATMAAGPVPPGAPSPVEPGDHGTPVDELDGGVAFAGPSRSFG